MFRLLFGSGLNNREAATGGGKGQGSAQKVVDSYKDKAK
jgi:hypothetical protein